MKPLSFLGAVAGGWGGANLGIATVAAAAADIGAKVAFINPAVGAAIVVGAGAVGVVAGAVAGHVVDDVLIHGASRTMSVDCSVELEQLIREIEAQEELNARARSSSSGRANLEGQASQAGSNQQQRNSRRDQQEEPSDSNEHDGWRRDPDKDKNLKIKGRVLTESEVLEQLRAAFKQAFEKALQFLRTQDPNAHLDLSQFAVTNYDFIIIRDEEGRLIRGAFPVEIEAIAKVKVRGGVQQFNVNINLDNPVDAIRGPRGPHVGLTIKKVGEFVASVGNFVGHISVNRNVNLPDRGRAIEAADLERQSQLWEIREIPIGFLFGQNQEFPFRLERIDLRDNYYDEERRVYVSLDEMNNDDAERLKYPKF